MKILDTAYKGAAIEVAYEGGVITAKWSFVPHCEALNLFIEGGEVVVEDQKGWRVVGTIPAQKIFVPNYSKAEVTTLLSEDELDTMKAACQVTTIDEGGYYAQCEEVDGITLFTSDEDVINTQGVQIVHVAQWVPVGDAHHYIVEEFATLRMA